MNPGVLVGLIDSGVRQAQQRHVQAARRFALGAGGAVTQAVLEWDVLDHGGVLAGLILAAAPATRLLNAQVFTDRITCAPVVIAAALDWAVAEGAQIINMSFGLRADRAVLRAACERALAGGVRLLAAAPARGPAVFPASYDGVLRITGDARCAPGQLSHLASRQADFGACPHPDPNTPGDNGLAGGGASIATARVTGMVAALAQDDALCGQDDRLADDLKRRASFHGPERR
jgi:hypothetical protein